MYHFDFEKYVNETSEAERLALIDRLIAARETGENKIGCNIMADEISFRPNPIYSDEYYGEVLDFNIALLLAHLGQFELACSYMEKSNAMPAGGDMLFSDHGHAAARLNEKRVRAAKNATPTILIASLPKSASASISVTLSNFLDIPILRTSIGCPERGYGILPRWLRLALGGGAVTHDHMQASARNLRILSECGVAQIFIQIRDPRSASWSYFNMRDKNETLIYQPKEQEFLENVRVNADWIASWIDGPPDYGIKAHWIFYQDIKQDMTGVCAQVIDMCFSDENTRQKMQVSLNEKRELDRVNLHQANDESWRAHFSDEIAAEAWHVIPTSVKELLTLKK